MQATTTQRNALQSVVDKLGIRPGTSHLNISYEAGKSILAGLDVRAGTLAQLDVGLAKNIPPELIAMVKAQAKAKEEKAAAAKAKAERKALKLAGKAPKPKAKKTAKKKKAK